MITFHPEASIHVDRTINLIKENGCEAGLVFNPTTPLGVLDWTLEQLDMVLLMSVNPGFGGQSFIPYVMEKIARVRSMIDATVSISVLRLMVVSRWTISAVSPVPVLIPLYPAQQFLAPMIMPRPLPGCGRASEIDLRAPVT